MGVNVVVKGTTNGTITDLDGKYSLEVEPNSILVVRPNQEKCRNMEKTSCNIPTPEELRNYIKESVISVTGTYEQSASVLMVDDSTIGTLGNFSASIGKAKSKKTFNVSAIAAAALKNGTVLHYRACFPEGKRKILYVDTEQGKNHCQIVLNRILKLAGLPKDCDAFNRLI